MESQISIQTQVEIEQTLKEKEEEAYVQGIAMNKQLVEKPKGYKAQEIPVAVQEADLAPKTVNVNVTKQVR